MCWETPYPDTPGKQRTSGENMSTSPTQKAGLIAAMLGASLAWQGAVLAENSTVAAT